MKVKVGIYVFSVKMSNGKTYEIYKKCKTLKGVNAYLTRWTNKICKQYNDYHWVSKRWDLITEFEEQVA